MKKIHYILFFAASIAFFEPRCQEKSGFRNFNKQEAVKLMQQVNQWYMSTPSYSFEITHATYAGHNETTPYQQKRGYFKKFAGGFHSFIMDYHTIQNKNYMLTVDTIRKNILINDPSKSFENNNFSVEEYSKVLEKCISVKISESAKTKTLRIECDKYSPVSFFEFGIGKDNLLQFIKVFYREEIKSLQGKMAKPKLSIIFQNYATGVLPAKNEIDDAKFFSVSKGIIVPAETYKNYKFSDQRIKNDKL